LFNDLRAKLKKHSEPTQSTFHQFLRWLDEGVDSEGQKYLEIRRRLVLYFDRKNCLSPDELADETLSRVAQKLEEKGAIADLSPAHYCYVVARFVFLEYIRRLKSTPDSFDESAGLGHPQLSAAAVPSGATVEATERLLDSLERCLNKLTPGDREIILEYYRGDGRTRIENRRQLADRLGLSLNALSIRACRIRNKVEACVRTGYSEIDTFA
jgi:DNA-directed RNA polymerase specialized sigma24 family protein